MSQPIDVVRKFVTEYQSEGKPAVAQELLAADFLDYTPFPGFGPSRDEVMRLFETLRLAFPDLRVEIIDQLADGDRVATRKTFHGTHRGPLFGIPGTGRTVSIRVCGIVRIKNGQIAEHWNVVDVAGLMAQLGVA